MILKINQFLNLGSTITIDVSSFADVNDIINQAHTDLVTLLDNNTNLKSAYRAALKEAHAGFVNNIDEFARFNHNLIIPFSGAGSRNHFKKQSLSTSFLDALTFFKISGLEVEIQNQHLNCKVDNSAGYGLYFVDGPQRNLKFNFIALLHELKILTDELKLPAQLVICILNASGPYSLPPEDSSQIVTDIFSNDDILKPLKATSVQCLNPTCAIIENEADITSAIASIRTHLCK